MHPIDEIRLHFSEGGLFFMNICLGFMMYGIALELRVEDFKRLFRMPRAAIAGVMLQYVMIPAIFYGLLLWWKPLPSFALGLILVAACPGGNISNFCSSLARANVALSVSLTAFTTVVASVVTPFLFAYWGSRYTPAAELFKTISLSPWDMVKTILLILILPMLMGMITAYRFPLVAAKMLAPIKKISLGLFIVFVIAAFFSNLHFFLVHIHRLFLLVLLANSLALMLGYFTAFLFGLDEKDRRTLSIETGIHNSGLGLILIFEFFNDIGGMAMVAAWWGIWDMLSALFIAWYWGRRKVL